MQRIKKSVLVPYAAAEMFELVDRVDLYPKFLPWCGGTEVLEAHDSRKTARIDIDYHGVRAQFTTDNVNDPPHSIVLLRTHRERQRSRRTERQFRDVPITDISPQATFLRFQPPGLRFTTIFGGLPFYWRS